MQPTNLLLSVAAVTIALQGEPHEALVHSMKLLQDQLAAIRQVDFTLHYRDEASGKTWKKRLSPQIANPRATAADCRIDYVWRWVQDGHLDHEQHLYIALPQVREIEVMPVDEAVHQADTRDGHPGWIAHADSPVFVVRADQPANDNNFPFSSEAQARQFAADLSRAVDLCGGHAPTELPSNSIHIPPLPLKKASPAVTLRWIADALEAIGPVQYVIYRQLGQGPVRLIKYCAENDHVHASASACRLNWHGRRVRDSAVTYNDLATLPLKDVFQIQVLPAAEGMRQADLKHHEPAATYRVVPSTVLIRITNKKGDDATFPMHDADLAANIAAMLSRAVDACGGGFEKF